MRKRIFFTIVIIAALFVFLLFNLLSGGSKNLPQTIFPFATPTPVVFSPSQQQKALTLLSVLPPNGASGISLDQSIIFTFNQPVATTSVSFAIFPDIPFTLISRLNMLIASPDALFEPGITYNYRLLDSSGKGIATASFSAGTNPNPILPLTGRYPNLDTVSDASQRQNYPDVFLAGYVPYQDNDFSVSSQFSASPSGHYVFSVNPSTTTAKDAFIAWLHGLGLTDEQISRIEILYASY